MNLKNIYDNSTIWFVTGSQSLYGKEIFAEINSHSETICEHFNKSKKIPVKIVYKELLTTEAEVLKCMSEANSDDSCAGVIMWMHTFSPAQKWVKGLQVARKPLLHLHTQFNRDIPFDSIDMDFMNLNQSAHGGREFGFINAKLGINREIIAGHFENPEVADKISAWSRVAVAWKQTQNIKVARFGDNMREVAVTEGNKVSALAKFGYSVHGYGIGDLVEFIKNVSDADAKKKIEEYAQTCNVDKNLLPGGENYASFEYSVKQELGLENFLVDGNFSAFTTTFEDLHGMDQLPGFACQQLMLKGYGFGAEGDWKTSALLHTSKVMAYGNDEGTSFMEDYTYHFDPKRNMVLGAHMLEVCPSLADGKVKIELHDLGIGGKLAPVRQVFNCAAGPAINASMIDLGGRFRLILNTVDALKPEEFPKLPVARVLWDPHPDLSTAASSWILAGGAHHTVYSRSLSAEQFSMFARIAGVEVVTIDKNATVDSIRNELRWNDLYYNMKEFV